MKAWGRLLRLSLAPTAAADIAAGVAAGAGGWPGGAGPFVLMIASLAVYHGGMVLNDWADRGVDGRTRPDRPIPSGAVRPEAALGIAIALLTLGPLLALTVSHASSSALLLAAIAAVFYDLRGRGAWIGPILLAICRATNLSAGILYGAGPVQDLHLLGPALLYGGYVFSVSRLARLEDAAEDVRRSSRPSIHLAIAALLLTTAPFAALLQPQAARLRLWAAVVLAAVGSAGLLGAAQGFSTWSGPEVTRATGLALRRLLVFTAAVALSAGGADGWIVAGAILSGYPVSYALRGLFPPS
jgi:hypothetical protein